MDTTPRPPGARKPAWHHRDQHKSAPPIRSGYFKSYDGTRLFYSIEGEGKPLIFCYGLVCSSLHWTYQIQAFSQRYQSIWFDYRGHHNSDAPADLSTLNVESLARDLECLMNELKLSESVILGHSMGVNVVLEFFRQRQERVTAMVLANGTARRPLETLFGSNASQLGFEIARTTHRLLPSLFLKLWKAQPHSALARRLIKFGGFNPHLTAEGDISLYLEQVSSMDPQILFSLIANYNQYDATPWLHTINKPCLILAGEKDKLVPPSEQELMQQLIPTGDLEVIRHGSHCPQLDLPELFNSKIERFLDQISY